MARLTRKQQLFVDAYVGEARGNATEAARLAGYKGNDATLGVVGHENLNKPKIATAIEQAAPRQPVVADREERHAFYTSIMRDPQHKASDRLRAAELLGKMQGDFIQRHEVTLGGTVEVVPAVARIPDNGRGRRVIDVEE